MPPLWAQLLHGRGLRTSEEARLFLDGGRAGLHDPFLLPEMDRAVSRIRRAMDAGETIAVFGDFDTDGVTATVLLQEALERMGGRVVAYIPHRVREGHGLSAAAVAEMMDRGVSLIITVDTGVTALEEVAQAHRAGIDVIITDHHVPGSARPDAAAVVTTGREDSAYPFPHLTGAGLAFKLVQALDQSLGNALDEEALGLAAVGTVADMAPLSGENRVLAREGLDALRRTTRPGLLELLKAAGTTREKLDHEAIPFVIAPRINSAGRMAGADLSYRLLMSRDTGEARAMATELEGLNNRRRQLTRDLLALALPEAARLAEREVMLVLRGEEYDPGVSGLVAGRIAERHHRPTVVVAMDGDLARASGRSIPEFDLAQAFAKCQDLFLRFGGHPAAAGFVALARDVPEIQERLQGLASAALQGVVLAPTLRIDAQVSVKDLLGETFRFIRSLAPFGQGNPAPVFITRGAQAVGARRMGDKGQHLRLTVRDGGAIWDAVAFDQTWPASLPFPERGARGTPPVSMDLTYTLEVNTYQGRESVQLRLLGLRPSRT
jgi:single-stranded-DNA-specific exonuclease